MTKKKHKAGRVFLTLIFLLVLAAAVIFGYCAYLAGQDNISDKYTLPERDEGITLSTLKGAVLGRQFELSENMLNTFINDTLCKDPEDNGTCIEHIRLYLHKDSPVEVYARVFYKGHPLAVRCKAVFELDADRSEIRSRLYEAYMGELKLPENLLDMLLERVAENNSRLRYINSGSSNIAFTSEYTFDIQNTSGITVRLLAMQTGDEKLLCRTNNLTGEALRAAVEYITSKEGRESIAEFFGLTDDSSPVTKQDEENYKDKLSELGDKLEQYKEKLRGGV